METADLSLDIVGNPGRLEDIHPILPGHSPLTLMEAERKWVGSPPPQDVRVQAPRRGDCLEGRHMGDAGGGGESERADVTKRPV